MNINYLTYNNMYKLKNLVATAIAVGLLIIPSMCSLWFIPSGLIRFFLMLIFLAVVLFWGIKILKFIAYVFNNIEGEQKIHVLVKNISNNSLPTYKTVGASAMDLRYFSKEAKAVDVNPGETKLIQTGLSIALPPGYEAQVRSRSGMSIEHGIIALNAPGTIDSKL